MLARLLFWFLAGATVAIWLMMILITVPRISEAAGGLPLFDLRVAGYTFEEAKAFLAALSPEGRAIYLGAHGWLDTIFPALAAATFYCALVVLLRPYMGGSGRFLAALAALAAVFDWLENRAVSGMLAAGADAVTPEAVAAASRWSVLKWGAYIVVLAAIVLLLLTAARRRWTARAA